MAEKQASDPNEDMKAKYREALERKSTAARPTSKGGGGGKGPGGAHSEHASEANKREFRRKSGG
jgi:hypothetical protein